MADGPEKRGGRKRPYKEVEDTTMSDEPDAKKDNEDVSPILKAFRGFQVELDSRYDKYERIVKNSRDVTIQSKRVIFLLHRCGEEGTTSSANLNEAGEKLQGIKKLFKNIAQELESEDPFHFTKAYSPGLQEFVEAYSFWYFLKHGCLVSFEEICQELGKFVEEHDQEKAAALVVPPRDYVLGVADLTGELMRLAINSVGRGQLEVPRKICELLRSIHDVFITFGNREKGLNQKFEVMTASLKKVENTCYTIHVRGSEMPKNMLASLVQL